MTITSGFFNSLNGDRTYNAAQMSEYYRGILSDGVVANYNNALQVLASSGLTVQVQTGRAYIDSRWLENDAVIDVTLNAAHVTLNRYTAIVVQLDYTNRQMSIIAVDGANATTPTKPAMQNTETIKQICLAYVYVAAGTTSITQSAITDTRANTSICGYVTGLVDQVDTTDLFNQWETAYNENIANMQSWESQMQTQFDNWFSTLTSKLNVNTYIQKYEKVVVLTNMDNPIVSFDWDGYTYSEDDVIFVSINGLVASSGIDYYLNTEADPVSIELMNIVSPQNETIDLKVLKSKIGFSTLSDSEGSTIVTSNNEAVEV